MSTINRIDGTVFSRMMISGANHLYNHKTLVDDLNVFPVPDGDTGTNMSLTAKAMAAELLSAEETTLTKAADKMSFATLRGARGNSGVILSQFFRGISRALKGKPDCDAAELAEAFSDGAKAAYKAVMKPTEGTILTVAREAAHGMVYAARTEADFSLVLKKGVERGALALERTPDQLPALKQAGVVDAGGQGWMFVLEGALSYLEKGEIVPADGQAEQEKAAPKKQEPVKAQAKISTENIKFKYCTEFIIQKSKAGDSVETFRSAISKKGDCMLVIDDDEIAKVHIHTNHPGFVLEEAVKLGEMINLKIDNMKHQHNSILQEEKPVENKPRAKVTSEQKKKAPKSVKQEVQKEYGFVAVCAGKGMEEILKDLGVDRIIEGGQTMNPSTEDILKAVAKVPAKTVFVFPNNKNIILAANQAKEISEKTVVVIPTKNVPQCISAMMAYQEKKDVQANEKSMSKAMAAVRTGQVTYAVRDTEADGKPIKKGDILGIEGSSITVTGDNPEAVCVNLTGTMLDEDSEFITVYYGKGMRKNKLAALTQELEQTYPDCEIAVKRGGQPLYYYIISVE